MDYNRPDLIDNAMEIAYKMSERSQDVYTRVGSVALDENNRIIACNFNGLPSKFDLTDDEQRDRNFRRKFYIHSELNSILSCPPKTIKTLVVTMLVCSQCLVACRAAGIKTIVWHKPYSSTAYGEVEETLNMAKRMGVELIQWKPKEKTI